MRPSQSKSAILPPCRSGLLHPQLSLRFPQSPAILFGLSLQARWNFAANSAGSSSDFSSIRVMLRA
jgi:hypothetical protein